MITTQVEAIAKREHDYEHWRSDVEAARRNMAPEYTPRGNSVLIGASGITARGAGSAIPRGYAAVSLVEGGAQHLAIVHQSGALYTWGVGAAGRLGLDVTEGGDPRQDCAKPTLVQALASVPVLKVSCGHSHSACITTAKDLYVWGSAASGKLGLGEAARDVECYASLPTSLRLGGPRGPKPTPRPTTATRRAAAASPRPTGPTRRARATRASPGALTTGTPKPRLQGRKVDSGRRPARLLGPSADAGSAARRRRGRRPGSVGRVRTSVAGGSWNRPRVGRRLADARRRGAPWPGGALAVRPARAAEYHATRGRLLPSEKKATF